MEKPVKLKNNGQINIVLNNEKKKVKPKKEIPVIRKKEVPQNSQKHEPLKQIEEDMSNLVGMNDIKHIIREIYAWIYINQIRKEQGLKPGNQVLHMMFKGNPGTGKTTIARLLGKFFRELNVLSKGHLIEAERADLVGEYIGHTAQKTRDLIKKAFGGILFIDEAYSLARGGEKDFGKEAIDTLVTHMEQNRDDFILILAGYSKEMNHFLSLNPGLQSRFPIIIDFPNYSVDELLEISMQMVKERQYALSSEAVSKLRDHLVTSFDNSRLETFSNGRYVRNLIEKAMRVHAMRLLNEESYNRNDLMTIRSHDIQFQEENPLEY